MPRLIEALSHYLMSRRTLGGIRDLDDRMLADIGLIGVDLRTVAETAPDTARRDVLRRGNRERPCPAH